MDLTINQRRNKIIKVISEIEDGSILIDLELALNDAKERKFKYKEEYKELITKRLEQSLKDVGNDDFILDEDFEKEVLSWTQK